MIAKTTKKQSLPRLSVLGLGKLGAPYAPFLARHGFDVLGHDVDEHKVSAIQHGRAPVAEPDLQKYIDESQGRLHATYNVEELISKTDVTFIIVPTPSEKSGLFSVDYVLSAMHAVGPALKRKKSWHTFVLVSTVLPGDSRSRIIPALEKASQKKCGKDFGYVYSPSLIAIGDILNNLEHPDFLFVGAYDEHSRKVITDIYKHIYPKEQALEQMSIESAELAKIALNSYITMKISFANTLAVLAHRIPNADVDEITTAIGKDSRIGKKYLKAGLGYGGPCFPRDNRAFFASARKRNVTAHLARATDTLNDELEAVMHALIEEHLPKQRAVTIGFLGVSYKPKTTLAEDSQALRLAQNLLRKKHSVAIFEPLGSSEIQNIFGSRVEHSPSLEELVKTSSVIFVSNADTLLAELPNLLKKYKTPKVVIDPWGMFEQKAFPSHVRYIAHGRRSVI